MKTNTLESMCELIVDCPHSTPEWTDSGYIVTRNQNIKNGVLDLTFPSYTNEEDYKKRIKRAAPKAGDIIFTREAPMGEVCMIPEGVLCCLGQRQVLLRPKNDVCGEYLFWALQSPFVQHQIAWNEGTGSTVSNVRIPVLKALDIPRQSAEEHIAKILSDLAEKIELNRQTNQTLEHMAQAIFKSWFVDFEPTRAKAQARAHIAKGIMPTDHVFTNTLNTADDAQADGAQQSLPKNFSQADADQLVERAAMAAICGKRLSELENLPTGTLAQLKTTAALFPETLVDSELGEVPEGWEVKTLDDVTSTIIDHRGKTPKKLGGDWVDEGYPAVSAKNIKSGRIVRHDTIRFLNDELYSKWMKIEIEKGDILLTSEAPMGEMYFITDEKKYCLSQRLYALRADNENVTPAYLYLWLQAPVAQADLEGRATGTTVVGIRQVELKKVNVLVPELDLLERFENLVFVMYEQLNVSEKESQELANLRDDLLPKLLAGTLIN